MLTMAPKFLPINTVIVISEILKENHHFHQTSSYFQNEWDLDLVHFYCWLIVSKKFLLLFISPRVKCVILFDQILQISMLPPQVSDCWFDWIVTVKDSSSKQGSNLDYTLIIYPKQGLTPVPKCRVFAKYHWPWYNILLITEAIIYNGFQELRQ